MNFDPSQIGAKSALPEGDQSLVLWAESPEEARAFLAHAEAAGQSIGIEKVFVAKRSPQSRTSRYVGGLYYPTSNDEHIDTLDESVVAPNPLINLVQWCTCDVMISRGSEPIFVLEDTTHIVRMNVYQRIPRLARAAFLGVPSLVLQGTRGLDFSKRGDRWGLYRYLQAFYAMGRLYKAAPPLPMFYLPNETSFMAVRNRCFQHLSALVNGDLSCVAADRAAISQELEETIAGGVEGDIAPDIQSIDHLGPEVIVRIGAKPDKKSWREKGSGQMDPYIGLIAAAKYIYCYDDLGKQIKPLVVEFTYLPEGFHFFQGHESSNSLYKRLAFEIGDEVRFLG